MKLTLLVIAILCLHIFPTSAIDIGLRILLNKGATTGTECTAAEMSIMLNTIDAVVHSRRRNLRQLPSYPSWCAQKCIGQAKGSCVSTDPRCDGYRRLENELPASAPAATPEDPFVPSAPAPAPTKENSPKTRDLAITSCADGISKANAELDALAKTLSSTCSSLLMAPRDVTCLTEIDNCDIQRMRLMNADTDTVLVESFQSGMSFCASGPAITFEAINDKCVCNVQFNLKNAAGQVIQSRFEYFRPFVLYSNSAPNALGVVNLYGTKLAVGAYTLEYYPDQDTSKTSAITFNVDQC